MKKLMALAAVLGLAVSSWGLTVQEAPEAQVVPSVGAVVAQEAQFGSWLAPRVWGWGGRRLSRYITYDNFSALTEGAMASIGGTIGGILGSSLSPGVGTIIGAGIGGGLGGW